MNGLLRRYATGILPRYIMGQVAKAFTLALLMLSGVSVLVVVVPKAAEAGLGPREIAMMLPLAVPSTLPYTAPVALLFAVSVVYGRVASDNEVLAIKASGQGAMLVLVPSFVFGAALSVGLVFLSNTLIPMATHRARTELVRNMEDMLYRYLKKERSFDNRGWPFKIEVKDVEGRELVGAVFSHRDTDPNAAYSFDFHVRADRAVIHFDQAREMVNVQVKDAMLIGDADRPDLVLIDNDRILIPLPGSHSKIAAPVQELTTSEIVARQSECLHNSVEDRRRQSIAAALWIGSGRPRLVNWPTVREAFVSYAYWESQYRKLETEKQLRGAIAFSPLFFALLGAPVGIWRARGDFLSAFMICFLPIILIYYPLTLAGINLGNEGVVPSLLALWSGNLVLAGLCGMVLRPVLRH